MEQRFDRYLPDMAAYHRRARGGKCFVCAIEAGDPAFPDHPIVYEDEWTIAFLNTNPTQYGYALVFPREHKEQATADFSVEEYLDLQRVVYAVAEAVREEVGAERMYVMTLGANQGNSHVHWHVVPLPPGVPYERQQFAALMLERAGALRIPEEEKAALAAHRSEGPADSSGLAGGSSPGKLFEYQPYVAPRVRGPRSGLRDGYGAVPKLRGSPYLRGPQGPLASTIGA